MATLSSSGILFLLVLFGVFRDEFVGGKLHGERRASAGDGAKFGGVVGHFLERHLGLDFLQTIFAGHAHDDGAVALQAAHDIAHDITRNEDFDIVNRFENFWIGVAECLRESVTSGQAE